MSLLSLTIFIWGVGLETVLLARALATRMTGKFPIFYSYIAFVLGCEIVLRFISQLYPTHYATDIWFYLVLRALAEFGVLFGVSEVIFQPYPALRSLGRLIVVLACLAFAIWFGLQIGRIYQPSWFLFLDLMKKSDITKAFAIAALLAIARTYRVPVSRNSGGILLGFAAYLTAHAATHAAALYFGRANYAPILSWMSPAGFGVCLSVWTVALWNPDPVVRRHPTAGGRADGNDLQLRRFSAYVTRLLSK